MPGPKLGTDASGARNERRRVCPLFWAFHRLHLFKKPGLKTLDTRNPDFFNSPTVPAFGLFAKSTLPTLGTLPSAFAHNRTFSPAPLSLALHSTQATIHPEEGPFKSTPGLGTPRSRRSCCSAKAVSLYSVLRGTAWAKAHPTCFTQGHSREGGNL